MMWNQAEKKCLTFSFNPVMRKNLKQGTTEFFLACSNNISLGCSLCADKFLLRHYDFKM